MALDDARVQDIRDGYESRIADLEATVAALREGHADADTALLEACRELVELIAEPPDAEELSWNAPQLRGLLGLFRNEARSVKSKLNKRLNSTAQVAKGE